MIKNSNQLMQAEHRLEMIQDEITELQKNYSGIDLEIFTLSLFDEKEKIEGDIKEFNLLTNYDMDKILIEKAIRPHLIDNIGELLTKIRIAKKYRQEEFSELLGWQQSNLSRFESEDYGAQSIKKIVEYASALGVWLKVYPTFTDEEEEVEISICSVRNTYPSHQVTWGINDRTDSINTEYENEYSKVNA